MILTVFTLSSLYVGLQNIPVTTSQQQSLRTQTFLCLLVPFVFLYFTKIALSDYIRMIMSFGRSNADIGKDEPKDEEECFSTSKGVPEESKEDTEEGKTRAKFQKKGVKLANM